MKTTRRILKAIGLSLFLAAFAPSDTHAVTTTAPVALLNDAEDIETLRAEVMKEYDDLYGMAWQFMERLDEYYYMNYSESGISEYNAEYLKTSIEQKAYELMSQFNNEQLHTDLQAIIDAIHNTPAISFDELYDIIDDFYTKVCEYREKVLSATSIEELVSLYYISDDFKKISDDINFMFEDFESHNVVFNSTNANQYYETIWNYSNELNYPIFHNGDIFMAKGIIFQVRDDKKKTCQAGYDYEEAILNPSCSECWDSENNTLILPDQVFGFTLTTLGSSSFEDTRSLDAIVLNESLEEIGYRAFFQNGGPAEIFIPQNVKVIGGWAFDTRFMEKFDVHPQNTYFHATSDKKGLVETATHTLVAAYQDIVIPQDITALGSGVFFFSKFDTKELPAGLKRIGESAFTFSELKTICLPEGLQYIDKDAFNFCANLTEIYLPASIMSIGSGSFGNCYRMQTIHADMRQPTEIAEDAFYMETWRYGNKDYTYDNAILYVPTGLRDAYATTPGWSKFKIILEEGEAPTNINNMTVQDSKPVHYNLSGQRVNNNYRGLVIENGRKVMVK